MLNEIVQGLPAINWELLSVFLGIGFLRLVYKSGKLTKHKWFAKRFRAKYIQMLNNEHTDDEPYLWLLCHLYQIKEEMKEHGDSNYAHIGNIITNLHDRPEILAPNLSDVCVHLTKYIGRLGTLNKNVWKWGWTPIVWLMEFVELVIVDVILRTVISANDFNSYSNRPVMLTIKKMISILLILYTVISGLDGFEKGLSRIQELFSAFWWRNEK